MDGHKWTRFKLIASGNLEKGRQGRQFRSLWQISWIKVVFAQNHLVCDVRIIILSVKEFHITFFEF